MLFDLFESFLFATVVLGILAVFAVAFGVRRYSYVINPLFQFAIFDIGTLTLLSAVVANELNVDDVNLVSVLHLSIVYVVGFFLVFLPRRFCFSRQLLKRFVYLVENNSKSTNYSVLNQYFLIVLVVTLFVLLVWISGAGMLWLTDPRLAYQSYRAGSGLIYVMVQWVLLTSLLYYFWTRKPQVTGLFAGVCLYSFAAYFTGSKANFLSGLVVACVYYNFFVKRIPTVLVVFAPFVMLGGFVTLLLLQGSYDDVFFAITYFKDYAETTGRFLQRFDEFYFQWGYGSFSDMWFYVPRVLYQDKPFEYGITLIHKVLFPGAAEVGATPGVLSWALAYLDFGVFGVFVFGVLSGFIRRVAYELFLLSRENVLAFILMMQLSLMPVYSYATLPLIILIGMASSLFFRKKIVFI